MEKFWESASNSFNGSERTTLSSELLKKHAKLENEPKLFTRSEVLEFMENALTLYELGWKRPKKSELEDLLP